MLLPSRNRSSLYSLLKFGYVTLQSVTPPLSGVPPPKKTDPESAPANYGEREHFTHAPLMANSKDQ